MPCIARKGSKGKRLEGGASRFGFRGGRLSFAFHLLLVTVVVMGRWLDAQAQGDAQGEEVWKAERRWKETPMVPAMVPDQMFLGDTGESYRNYAFTEYQNYDSLTDRPPWSNIYDPLGNFLISGRELGSWSESRGTAGQIRSGSSILRSNLNRFHGLLSMGGQSHSGWAGNLIFTGHMTQQHWWTDGIITRFTPLTLNRVSLQGARADVLSPYGDALSLVAAYIYSVYRGGWSAAGTDSDSGILLAGHYERETGPLRVGATFANQHMFDVRYPTTDLRGDLHATQAIPALLAVRISDDSPGDGRGGPMVYGVQLVVNGEVRPDLVPDVVRRDLTDRFTVVGKTSPMDGSFRPSRYYEPGIARTPGPYWGMETPLFADYLYRRDYALDPDDPNVASNTDVDRLVEFVGWEDPSQVQRADGTEALVYYFDLEGLTHVRSVEVEASVGNDYRIEVADLSVSNPREGTPYDTRYGVPFYKTVRRAEGNVQDLSNVERIRIPIGTETGQSVWGVNMALDLVGLRVRGEFAESITYSRYRDGTPGEQVVWAAGKPVLREANGARHRRGDRAGYVQLERETERYGFGGELFSIGPMFNQRLSARPGDLVLQVQSERSLENKTSFFSLLDDNDDQDSNPESKIPGAAPGDLSVFPGQDADNDGIPDTNRNLNQLPDYLEPFLLYEVDPDEYVYGLDFNNNDVVDEREDDQEVDLPYDRDLRGAHGYIRWQPWTGAGATVGWLQSHQIAGGGRNDQGYIRLRYSGEHPGVGEWLIEDELKRVWDDVPDDVYSWTAFTTDVDILTISTASGRFSYERTFVTDQLNYRNSLVNRLYLSGILKWLPGWRIVTRLKLEHNRQYGGRLGDGSEQDVDRIRSLAWVQQADYTWRWGNLTLQPALKGLWLKRIQQLADRALDHTRTVVPLVMARYELSPATEVKAGLQGLPGWWFEETHLAEPRNSFKRRTTMVFLSNMSDYSGYKISTNLGVKQDRLEYADEFRFLESFDTTEIFVRLFMGYAQNVLY